MSSITAFQPARFRFAPPAPITLDQVIARYARSHEIHVSPIVGCSRCLHNVPRVASRDLPAAA